MEMRCDQCEAAMINGVYCHERGCPNWWKHVTHECAECGSSFRTEEEPYHNAGIGGHGSVFCDEQCARAYNGLPSNDCEECHGADAVYNDGITGGLSVCADCYDVMTESINDDRVLDALGIVNASWH